MPVPAFPRRDRPSSNEASASVARKIAMIVDLLQHRCLRFSQYESTYSRDYRSFQRDLQQLRKIGEGAGFTLSAIRDRETVDLMGKDRKPAAGAATTTNTELLRTVAIALGEPILRSLGLRAVTGEATNDFFQFVMPRLAKGSKVADICEQLRAASQTRSGRACVRFGYPQSGAAEGSERIVEPYRVVNRSGSYYLIGYDRDRKDWRTFSIDRFITDPVRAGTCQVEREMPREYASNDVIGFIKGSGPLQKVTIELTARVAPTAISRIWQNDQHVQERDDGSAAITFIVTDVDEVIRWALGYGAEARVVAPAAAVKRATEMLAKIVKQYHSE